MAYSTMEKTIKSGEGTGWVLFVNAKPLAGMPWRLLDSFE
jgi:hypothetical protein